MTGSEVVVDDTSGRHSSEAQPAEAHPSGAVSGVSEAHRQVPPPPAFTMRQLDRIDEALTMASRETELYFTLYIGALDVPTRGHAERLHAQLGSLAPISVLIAVSPGQRVLEIVTGDDSAIRIPDRSCAIAAASMTASFGSGDLTGGIVNGLRILSDQARHPRLRR